MSGKKKKRDTEEEVEGYAELFHKLPRVPEPSSTVRLMCREMAELKVGLGAEGFDEDEAFDYVRCYLLSEMRRIRFEHEIGEYDDEDDDEGEGADV